MSEQIDHNKKSNKRKKRVFVPAENLRLLTERLLHLFEQRNETETKIAKQINISKSTISKAFNEGKISLPTAIALSKYFNVSIDYLLGLNDIESPAIEALNILRSQIMLSERATEKGTPFLIAKISKPLSDYLNVLMKISIDLDMPQEVKDYYLQSKMEPIITALVNNEKQDEQDMQEYLIIGYKPIPPDFDSAIDDYLRL